MVLSYTSPSRIECFMNFASTNEAKTLFVNTLSTIDLPPEVIRRVMLLSTNLSPCSLITTGKLSSGLANHARLIFLTFIRKTGLTIRYLHTLQTIGIHTVFHQYLYISPILFFSEKNKLTTATSLCLSRSKIRFSFYHLFTINGNKGTKREAKMQGKSKEIKRAKMFRPFHKTIPYYILFIPIES